VSGTRLSGACDDHAAAEVYVEGLDDDEIATARILVRVRVDDPSSDTEPKIVWLQGDRGVFGAFSLPEWQSCLHNFPGVSTERNLEAVVTALDWSGNESDPSETATFRFQDNPWAEACSCSTPGSGALGGLGPLAVFAAALLVFRRRRRR